jgi:aspartyl-tRNA(Asn)/glutamyl-tRNA(Gln) amidotransferase subunit A
MVLQGADPADLSTLRLRDAAPMRDLRRGVKGLRLARLPEAERAGVEAETLAAYDRSVEALAAQGAEIVELHLPGSLADLTAQVGRIISAEIYAKVGHLAEDAGVPLDADIRGRVLGGRDITANDYLKALAAREAMKAAFETAMTGIDAVLTPTMTMPAPVVAEIDQSATPAGFTRWVNFLDLCAVAVPNGMTQGGLPLSLQIICRGGEEALALRIGWAYQAAHDWHLRAPEMAA